MKKINLFLFEPAINERYNLLFTKKFPFIKIFGKSILIWSVNCLIYSLNNLSKNLEYQIYILINTINEDDIIEFIEKFSKSNYKKINNFNYICNNNIEILFLENKDLFKFKILNSNNAIILPIGLYISKDYIFNFKILQNKKNIKKDEIDVYNNEDYIYNTYIVKDLINLNNNDQLIKFTRTIASSAEQYYYVPEEKRKFLFSLYD